MYYRSKAVKECSFFVVAPEHVFLASRKFFYEDIPVTKESVNTVGCSLAEPVYEDVYRFNGNTVVPATKVREELELIDITAVARELIKLPRTAAKLFRVEFLEDLQPVTDTMLIKAIEEAENKA